MSEFMDTTLHSNIALPELAISSSTSHGTKDEFIDFNDLSDVVRADKWAHSSSGINSNNNTTLELESKSCCTLCEICHFWGQLLEVSLELNLIIRWMEFEVESIRSNLVGEVILAFLFKVWLL
jgi:hypothetical protein